MSNAQKLSQAVAGGADPVKTNATQSWTANQTFNGSVGVGSASDGARLNVTHTTTFDPSNARITPGIIVQQSGNTQTDSATGGAITLSKVDSYRPGACLVAYQDGADADRMGFLRQSVTLPLRLTLLPS